MSLKAQHADTSSSEVFFDPSGRRWRRAKRGTLLLLACTATLLWLSWGRVQEPPPLRGYARPPPIPELEGLSAPPMIGAGPLVRLVRVERQSQAAVAIDPLGGGNVGTLTRADLEALGTSQYALYRYGIDQGVRKTILLTFDDGPDPNWTPQILDLLGQNKVPATFFVVGSAVVRHPDLVQRQVREGHAIGNHTMTHPEITVATAEQEIVTADRILAATAGVRTDLVPVAVLRQ